MRQTRSSFLSGEGTGVAFALEAFVNAHRESDGLLNRQYKLIKAIPVQARLTKKLLLEAITLGRS